MKGMDLIMKYVCDVCGYVMEEAEKEFSVQFNLNYQGAPKAEKVMIKQNTGNIKNSTSNATQNNTNNTTIVGDNSVLNISALNKTNGTYKIYDPQSDSYVTVIGEKFDNGVNRWYTYDKDGVRYYNTRINH